MPNDLPRPLLDALQVLLTECVRNAGDREDVRRSLETLGRYLVGVAQQSAKGPARAQHGVLTPAARLRSEASRPRVAGDDSGSREGARISAPLSVVVTRARWKASACRLSIERRDARKNDSEKFDDSQFTSREASLRARLKSLPDTSTWMLDTPFGKRAGEPGAFEVPNEVAGQLTQIAHCYDSVATAAEVAMELDESGAFANGPAPSFLYLMAEAQSALLQSLDDAPTRVDSDQRALFLWLKDQTTRYRIYVDRFMRLDDPADPTTSADLQERLRRGARDVLDDQERGRRRRDALAKIHYHTKKILESPESPPGPEVESLGQALARWSAAGFDPLERGLQDALVPLRALPSDSDVPSMCALKELLGSTPERDRPAQAVEADTAPQNSSQGSPRESLNSDEIKSALSSRSVGILLDAAADADLSDLQEKVGARSLAAVRIDLTSDDSAGRGQSISEFLDSGTDLFLLGVKLPPEEYSQFKGRCLERDALFVRLPGPLEACLLYTSPSPRDQRGSRMPSSA